ncbi:MAG TPA: hypothetical protein VGK04_01055 [Thermoanaerobaculia bacterium]|jgi:putative pyruvate formate lyase activating enzyme
MSAFQPAYLKRDALEPQSRVDADLADCRVCPRNCDVNRLSNETRTCHTGRHAIVSSAFAHFGEEDGCRKTAASA